MSKKVGVLNYEIGNIRSIQNALVKLGHTPEVTDDRETIMSCDALIIPGVGSFPYGIQQVREKGLEPLIHDFAKTNKTVIGICLGMQLLFDIGHEQYEEQGLGLIPGEVKKITEDPNIRIPNIEWRSLIVENDFNTQDTSFSESVQDKKFYFVHSYSCHPVQKEHKLASTVFEGIVFTSAVRKDNIYGFQFHPEKSGPGGLHLLNLALEA